MRSQRAEAGEGVDFGSTSKPSELQGLATFILDGPDVWPFDLTPDELIRTRGDKGHRVLVTLPGAESWPFIHRLTGQAR
jgi:hypothetical protein